MTTTTLCPTQSTETLNEIPLPEFSCQVQRGKHSAADFINGINPNKVLSDVVQAMNKWVFSSKCHPKHFKSITVSLVSFAPESHDFNTRIYDDKAIIHLTDISIYTLWKDHSAKKAHKFVIDCVCGSAAWLLRGLHSGDKDTGSYPFCFWIGIANYAKLKEGSYPRRNLSSQKDEMIWHGENTMPYFLEFLDKTFGEGTVRTIFAELGSTYDKGVFQNATKLPITTLWKMYRESVGIEVTQGEEWISNLNELWPLPNLKVSLDVDPKHKELCANVIPIEALAKAVVATFMHLYTPQSAPANIKEFRLILQCESKGSEYSYSVASKTVVHFFLQSGAIHDLVMGALVNSFYHADCPTIQSHSPSLKVFIEGFILLKENLFRPKHLCAIIQTGQRDSRYECCLAIFAFWLESACGYRDTMRKFCELLNTKKEDMMKDNKYWKSCWEDNLPVLTGSGKTFDELWKEFESTFSEKKTNNPDPVKDAKLDDLETPRAPKGPKKSLLQTFVHKITI